LLLADCLCVRVIIAEIKEEKSREEVSIRGKKGNKIIRIRKEWRTEGPGG
jgi:hypothetical protein